MFRFWDQNLITILRTKKKLTGVILIHTAFYFLKQLKNRVCLNPIMVSVINQFN